MSRQFPSSKDSVKTILVFLVSLTIGLALPNPTWAHGGGSSGGSGGGRERQQ